MKKIAFIVCTLALVSCKTDTKNNTQPETVSTEKTTTEVSKITEVAHFKGQQVTGVTVSDQGRIFANFPRWRTGVNNAVVEIDSLGTSKSFPNARWNSWKIDAPITDSTFIAVQSVVAFEDQLYVLDTRNPQFKGLVDSPRVFVFDLKTEQLAHTYILTEGSFHNDSYINDLRVDKKNQVIYFTDSGHAGLVILNLKTGVSKRVLDNHASTLATVDFLTFNDKKWERKIHSDGIALDSKNDLLYYHSLTGYHLFSVPTETLISGSNEAIEKSVKLVMKTSAPDGMILDDNNNLYLADLEHDKIMKIELSTGTSNVFAEGAQIKWADTFSIFNNQLYYTNSRINEIEGDINNFTFTINKIDL